MKLKDRVFWTRRPHLHGTIKHLTASCDVIVTWDDGFDTVCGEEDLRVLTVLDKIVEALDG